MVAAEARGKLARLIFGHMAAEVVRAAAGFRVADLIGDGERTAAEVAQRCGALPESMNRLLRALAALELLTETRPGHFSLTEVGALLRTDRPDSMDAVARMFTDPVMVGAWPRLDESIRTGRTAFDEVFGTDFFSHLSTQTELSELFNAAMSQATLLTAAMAPAVDDFGRFSTIVDVGGGNGTLIAGILGKHQSLRGILFDTPAGLAQAETTLRQAAVEDRCAIVSGDFFESVPEGGDLYLLKSIVHDWEDERAATILGHCRRVLPEHGRLMIIEPVLPEAVNEAMPAIMYLSDLNMLVNLGGRERTRTEFENLCRRAGFTITTVTPLAVPAAYSLIEAAPA